MRQVPHYLIIGNGRVARHFQHYFTLCHLPFSIWHKGMTLDALKTILPSITHILILISDQHIDAFIQENLLTTPARMIHFSGSLISPYAVGAHPLMSFSDTLYDLAKYQSIPFVVDNDAPAFETILPGLPNASFKINKHLKAKYHALCVLSGNFSCLLWQKLFDSLEQEFNLPANIAHAYLQQQTQNLLENSKTALTGPLVRNDTLTLKNNLDSLQDDPFQAIYHSFITCYQQLQSKGKT